MVTALAALGPVFLLVLMGFILKRAPFPGAGVWPAAEKLTYFVLFPALLFGSLATAKIEAGTAIPMAAALVIATLATAGLTLAFRPKLAITGPAFTSFFQGAIRPNTYVGIAVALGIWGQAGVVLVAVAIAVVVPLVNLLSVAALERYGENRGPAPGRFIRAVLGNPLIAACAGGALVNVSGIELAGILASALDLAGKGALVLGLMCVGAALEPQRLRGDLTVLAWVSGFKLLIFPGIAALAAFVLGVPGPAFGVTVMYAALPVSASSYVLASQMGGDRVLMAGALTATTILALPSLSLLLMVLG